MGSVQSRQSVGPHKAQQTEPGRGEAKGENMCTILTHTFPLKEALAGKGPICIARTHNGMCFDVMVAARHRLSSSYCRFVHLPVNVFFSGKP